MCVRDDCRSADGRLACQHETEFGISKPDHINDGFTVIRDMIFQSVACVCIGRLLQT